MGRVVTESLATEEKTFLLPDLGEGLTEAEVLHWLVTEGEVVVVDQPIVEVETAKSIVEVPTPYAGTVRTLHGAPGQILDVGGPLITITSVTAAPEGPAESGNVLVGYGTTADASAGRRRRPRQPPTTSSASNVSTVRSLSRVASPLVRRLARDGGVDLGTIDPTGPGGVITRSDVVRALAAVEGPVAASNAPATAPPTPSVRGQRRTPLTGFRKTVATALSRSRTEIPEATVWVDVDATKLWELREGSRAPADPGPGLLSYVARFVVAGLRQYPVLNARLDTERHEIVEHDAVHLGLAVQTTRGLVAPAVLGAQAMTTAQLDAAIRDVTKRAREGKASIEEMTAGTFTLNNYGAFNVDGSAAIINHPQVAILGIGRIIDRPWVVDGEIVLRKITQMSFVFDHRVCDGDAAAGFMRIVADATENPASAISLL
jgi:2-oxoisovalerate dehydrogenase E2 component (dihydrolipoyl transacylase)